MVSKTRFATAVVRTIDNKRERLLSILEMDSWGAALMELETEGKCRLVNIDAGLHG